MIQIGLDQSSPRLGVLLFTRSYFIYCENFS